jgi:hypothetical protein
MRPTLALRTVAALVVVCVVGSCASAPPTSIEKKDVDTRHLQFQALELNGLVLKGAVLTPDAWPLESSMKRLLDGDLEGVIQEFNVRFQPGTIPSGALQDLYNAGYVPAYVRISNPSGQWQDLNLSRIWINLEDKLELPSVPANQLPGRFTQASGQRMSAEPAREADTRSAGDRIVGAVGVSLIYIAVVAVIDSMDRNGIMSHAYSYQIGPLIPAPGPASTVPRNAPAPSTSDRLTVGRIDDGLIRSGSVAANDLVEGLVFFRVPSSSVEWKTAKLIAH